MQTKIPVGGLTATGIVGRLFIRVVESVLQELKLPRAPKPIVYLKANDRPLPRFDADSGAGMAGTVGRMCSCGALDWKFTVLSHNRIRCAEAASLLNAELLKARGFLG